MATALGITRTQSRMAEDTARVESPSVRVFDACFGYFVKYNLRLPEAVSAPAVSKAAPEPATAQPQPTSESDSMGPFQSWMSSPPKFDIRWHARGAPGSFRARCTAGTSRDPGNLNKPRRRPRSRPSANSHDPGARLEDKHTGEQRFLVRGAGVDD